MQRPVICAHFKGLWKVIDAGHKEGKPDLDTCIGESVSCTCLQVEAAEFK